MSKHLAAHATARALLGRVDPLLAHLDDTLERWGRYRHLRPVEGYYARLYDPIGWGDADLDAIRPAGGLVVDGMVRRVSGEFRAWSTTLPGAVPIIAASGYERLLTVLASHPDGYLREAAVSHLADIGKSHVLQTLVLRCVDHVPQVREVAIAAVDAVLDDDPMALHASDYAVLKRPRALRLAPDLATRAAKVQATDYYARRRDRDDVDLVDVVGWDALVEVEDLPMSEAGSLLDALADAGIEATTKEVPSQRDRTILRVRPMVRAVDEPLAREVALEVLRRRWRGRTGE